MKKADAKAGPVNLCYQPIAEGREDRYTASRLPHQRHRMWL
jgi:hypothetical protein